MAYDQLTADLLRVSDGLRNRIAELEQQHATATDQLTLSVQKANEMQASITALESQVAERDARIAEMQEEIDGLNQDLEDKQREVEHAFGSGWRSARDNPGEYL